MNNAKRKEIDGKVIQEISSNGPEGFNKIKRSINEWPRTLSLSLKRLTTSTPSTPSLLIHNSQGPYCLSSETEEKLKIGRELILPGYTRAEHPEEIKKKISSTMKHRWKERKIQEKNEDKITFFVLRLAASGVNFIGHIASQFKRIDLISSDVWRSPYIETVPGVAIEDFYVGQRRDFATGALQNLGFERSEIKSRIAMLVTKLILKPIRNDNIECINQEQQRYEIAIPLLKEFIKDIQRLIYHILQYWITETWQYQRPKREELKWYMDINSRKSSSLGRTYIEATREMLYNKQRDTKIQKFVLKHLIKKDRKYTIEYLKSRRKTIAETINKKWEFIEQNYNAIQINYPGIYKLMKEKAYPDFIHE